MSKTAATGLRFPRLLRTGAAGGLGRVLRPRLRSLCEVLRVSDIAEMDRAEPGEEVVRAPLQDRDAVLALLKDVSVVVHLGGISTEHAFDEILPANIVGTYNVYEAARIHGVQRIVFASSNHVTGFYAQSETIDARMPMRPDSYYGVSKAFGENLAQFYFDRYGIETVSLRIGSCFPEPLDRRQLASWLSYDDLERLVVAALAAPAVGHSVIYGISDNQQSWWDNAPARHIGFRPLDSADPYRPALEARQPVIDPAAPVARFQGGIFVAKGPFESAEQVLAAGQQPS